MAGIIPYKSSYDKTNSELENIKRKRSEISAKINQIDADDIAILNEIANLKKSLNGFTGTAAERQEIIEKISAKEEEHLNKLKEKSEQLAIFNDLNKQEQQIRTNSTQSEDEQTQKKNANNTTTPGDSTTPTTSLDSITSFNPLTGKNEESKKTPTNYVELNSSTPASSLTSNAEDAEVVALRAELKKEGNMSAAQADVGSFEQDSQAGKTGAGEIVVINQNDHSLFAGLKLENVDYGQGTKIDSYTSERIKYYQSKDKTKGFIIPWDGRLGLAYSSTESVGNYMPYGEEWVGSPSLMNPYALIRFEHIASRKHHHYILDQRNSKGGFRGTKFKPYVNVKDYSAGQIKSGSNGQSVVQVSDEEKKNMGVLPGEEINYDDSGAMYIEETDYSQQTWQPTKAVKQTIGGVTRVYETKDSPASVVVNTPEYGKSKEIERLNKLRSSADQIKSKTATEGMDGSLTPDQPGFWLVQKGWEKCGDLYVTAGNCENGKIAEAQKAEIEQIRKRSDELKAYVNLQVSRNWKPQKYASNRKYLRKPNTKTEIREPLEPTYNNLCNPENWSGQEQFQYRYVDFLYNSYYGWIPNNQLITLRRYPVPINDSGTVPDQDKTKQHILPVAQAITYMGDATGNLISDLMSFSARMNWRDVESQVNEIQGNEQGAQDSPFGAGFSKWLGILSGQSDFSRVSGWDEQRAKFDPYSDGMYANRIFGPVNVVTKTKARARGLEFDHSINLNFHYSLKSLGGVNPKAAMLDIMSNLLALTYNNANFWGGANRYFPNKPAYPFLGGKKGMQSWYSGNVTGFLDGIADQLLSAMGNLGSLFQGLLTNPKEALKNIAGKGAQVWMADKQREKRPAILGFKALLTGEPVGEWHMVVGNPFNPIAQIGNLICTGIKFAFSDQLGADDFPEEMTATISLEHGRPRDKGDIESMFNRGGGRLHYSYYGTDTEVWNQASSTRDSKIDESWKGNKTTVDDNFSGKTQTVQGYSGKGNSYTSAGATIGISEPFPQSVTMAKMYSSTCKQAHDLAAKVGFKSGS